MKKNINQMNIKLKYLVSVIIISLITNLSFSQENKDTSLTTYIDSVSNLNSYTEEFLIEVEKKILQYDTIIYANQLRHAYRKLGNLYSNIHNYPQAIEQIKKAVQFNKKIKDTLWINRSLHNLRIYYGKLKIKKDKEQLSVCEEIIRSKTYKDLTYQAYNEAAGIYTKKGDFYKALIYYEEVIDSYKVHHNNSLQLVIAHIGSLGAYTNLKIKPDKLARVLYHYNETEKYSENLPDAYLAINNNNLANIYSHLNQYREAISHYNKALLYFSKTKEHETVGLIYNNLGQLYSGLNDTLKGTEYFNKALEISENLNVFSIVYHNKGYFLKTSKSIEKIPYFQKAIKYRLDNHYDYNSLTELPRIKIIKESGNTLDVLEDLIQIANTWMLSYKEDKDISKLLHAKKTIDLIDELISHIRFESSKDQSKLFWINKGVNIYMLGVEVSYLLNDTESALYYMEKNKALLLLENLNNNKTQEPHISTLKEIKQNYVSKKSNFIEYILSDSAGYGIFCSDLSTHFFKIDNPTQLLSEIELLKKQCSKPFLNKGDGITYTKNSHSIFQQLFPFKDALQHISGKKLTIVSDYKIKNVSFEALMTSDKTNNLKNNYLINKTEISYLYSASVSQQLKKKERKPENTILGIAPINFKIDSLVSLENSNQDIERLSDLFSTTFLKKEDATKETVLSSLNNYKVIHLNTHAGYNKITNEPWMALYDGKISLHEIYNQPLQSDLVVLDACKSSIGKLEIGEGVMSLSRAFIYSGAKSVIASKWNVNEQASSKIYNSFYEELYDGQSKSQALHKAKLNYINTHQLSEISPYYWASLTLVGDAEGVIPGQTSYKWYLFIAIGILLLLFILFFRYKRKN